MAVLSGVCIECMLFCYYSCIYSSLLIAEVNKETQKDPDDHVIVKDLSTVDLTITSPNMLPTQVAVMHVRD